LEPGEKRFTAQDLLLYHSPRDREQATRVRRTREADNDRIMAMTDQNKPGLLWVYAHVRKALCPAQRRVSPGQRINGHLANQACCMNDKDGKRPVSAYVHDFLALDLILGYMQLP
jgi:hypothetical protein